MSAPAPVPFSPAATARLQRLGLRKGRANLEEFADTLLELARSDPTIIAVTSDSRGSGKLGPFGKALPEQIVEVGIAEQNLVGITAGLSACGQKAFGVSPSCFLTARSLEQIKNDICYSDVPAVLVGISAGVSYGALGTTHHSLHDLAALRALHNLTVLVPADNLETRACISYAAAAKEPVFVRFGKAAMYDVHPRGASPNLAVPTVLRHGHDAALLATGETVIHALLAADLLASEGISCRVISLPMIRPLDTKAVINAAADCKAVVTVEEHMIHGGLGEAVASLLLEAGVIPRFQRVGFPDADIVTGAQADLFRHYGISMEGLADTVQALLKGR